MRKARPGQSQACGYAKKLTGLLARKLLGCEGLLPIGKGLMLLTLILVASQYAFGDPGASGTQVGPPSIQLTGRISSDGEVEYATEALPALSGDGERAAVVERFGAPCSESVLRIMAVRTGDTLMLLPLTVCSETDRTDSMEQTARRLAEANQVLILGRYIGLTKLVTRFSPENSTSGFGDKGSAYDPASGAVTLGTSSGLRETWSGDLPRLTLDCGPNGKSSVYPTHVDAWTDRAQTVLVFQLLALGPQDWCGDLQHWLVVRLP